MADEAPALTPNLKITGLHIAGYRSIKRLDLPEDGIAWAGQMPDIILVGGANGSGKTTLLEGLFRVFDHLCDRSIRPKVPFHDAEEFRLDLSVRAPSLGGTQEFRLAAGNPIHTAAHASKGYYRLDEPFSRAKELPNWQSFLAVVDHAARPSYSEASRVLYFPTDRQLLFPDPEKQSVEYFAAPMRFAWRFTPANTHEESLLAELKWGRFQDLSAKEEGRQERVSRFAAYADAFRRFVDQSKTLVWQGGHLRVRTTDGALHPLPELSSGEKQVLLFASELHHRWTPGSLVLIDEPELHLHAAWQTTLFQLIRDLQRERGGQAILTTQSNHLFGLAEPGTAVVLRRGWP